MIGGKLIPLAAACLVVAAALLVASAAPVKGIDGNPMAKELLEHMRGFHRTAKETGKLPPIPWEKLSEGDRAFVQQVKKTAALHAEHFAHDNELHQKARAQNKTIRDIHSQTRFAALGDIFPPNHGDICDQVRGFEMPCEHHTVETADGFLLDVIRIPPKQPGGYPIILQHGLLDAAESYVFNAHAYQNLGNMLHDQGYDLWMPNSRGNQYSMGNTKLNWLEWKYWDSIDCDLMAMYDMPANIDYVLQQTNRTTLSWVGHSQGTWQMFAGMSTTRREYAPKVDLFVALAPVAYVDNQKSVLLSVLAALHIADIIDFIGAKEFMFDNWLIHAIATFCAKLNCPSVLEIVMGDGNSANVNSTHLRRMTSYIPGGTSSNNMVHWTQMVRYSNFGMHDYGGPVNELTYHSWSPPQYNLKQMEGPPTAIFYGGRDYLGDPTDVETLIRDVPNATIKFVKEVPDYAHLDFIWGLNAYVDIYPDVLRLIAQYAKH